MPLVSLRQCVDRCLPRLDGQAVVYDFQQLENAYCHRCGASMAMGAVTERGCAFCIDQKQPWDYLFRLGAYDDDLRQWILGLKYQNAWAWHRFLGRQLAHHVKEGESKYFDGDIDCQKTIVTAVPLHFSRRFSRGYNQAGEIARVFSKALGLRYQKLLRRPRRTSPQHQISSIQARLENVKGAFKPTRCDLTGLSVFLVDDIKTTGATLTQCAKLLKKMGAQRVYGALVAVADFKGQKFTRK